MRTTGRTAGVHFGYREELPLVDYAGAYAYPDVRSAVVVHLFGPFWRMLDREGR